VAVFVADDPAKHSATIRGRAVFPDRTRVVRVRYSDRERDRVERRIMRDERSLAKAGFTVVETDSFHFGTDRIDVFLVTRRTDHAAYFARRYGSLVKTHVVSREQTALRCVRAGPYEIAPDGLSLTVSWSDAGPKPERIDVTETADRVVIGIVERGGFEGTFGDTGGTAVVRLGAPLGTRAVYDAYDGGRMLQSGPSPGDPPCPVRPERTPLQSAMVEREQYGMNTDPGYVQWLLGQGRTFTEHEERWIESVRRVDFQSKINDYVHHWSEAWGGNTLVADYPAKPYLLVRLLRRREVHERRLKRLAEYPDQLRTQLSSVQRDWFYDLPQHIGDDAGLTDGFFDGYGRDGIYFVQAEGDESTQSVGVTVITPRTDAAEYLTRRYGPLVKVTVIGDRFECRGSYFG
jgi:hypothetical protein